LECQKVKIEKGKIGAYAYLVSEIAAMALSGYILLSAVTNPKILNTIREDRFKREYESALVKYISNDNLKK